MTTQQEKRYTSYVAIIEGLGGTVDGTTQTEVAYQAFREELTAAGKSPKGTSYTELFHAWLGHRLGDAPQSDSTADRATEYAKVLNPEHANWDSVGEIPNNAVSIPAYLTVTRAGTSATFIDANGQLQPTVANQLRIEQPGLLLEGSRLNRMTVFNANPDAALLNWNNDGDPAATFTRVDDSAKLAEAQLELVCTSGFACRLNNTAGVAVASFVGQDAGSLNPTTMSLYMRGTGAAELRIGNVIGPKITLTDDYVRYSFTGTPNNVGNSYRVTCDPGSDVYSVLHQYETTPFATSVIVTAGATVTRPADVAQILYADAGIDPLDRSARVEMTMQHRSNSQSLFYASVDVNNGVEYLVGPAGTADLNHYVGGVTQAGTPSITGPLPLDTLQALSGQWVNKSFTLTAQGETGSPATGTSAGDVPATYTAIRFNDSTIDPVFGHYQRIATLPVANINPMFSSASVPAAGTTLVVTFDRSVAVTDGTGFTITGGSGGTITGASALGAVVTLTLSGTVLKDEVLTVSYDKATGNVADATTDIPAASFTNESVANNSTQEAGGDLPLDLLTNDELAWSTRLLRSDYIGDVVRVRRSSDNAEQDFTEAELNDTTLTTFVGAGDGFITTFYGQNRGTQVNATRTTASAQPQIVAAGVVNTVNGRAAAIYDGTNDDMRATHTVIAQPLTVYSSQTRATNANTDAYVYDSGPGTSTRSILVFQQDLDLKVQSFAGGTLYESAAPAHTLGQSSQATVLFNGTSSYIRVDGAEVAAAVATAGSDGMTNCIWGNAISVNRPWISWLGDMIVCSGDKSADNEAVEASIRAYWGTPAP